MSRPHRQPGRGRPSPSAPQERPPPGEKRARDATQAPGIAQRLALDAALIVAAFLAYLPVMGAGFIWDDDAHVSRPDLQSLSGLGRIWSEPGATQQYYPLLHSAFWVEHRLWGQSALGYHLLNIGLHAAAALLLARLVVRLAEPSWSEGLKQGCAYLAAGLFALHPVEVESVAWISEQKNTLSIVCALSATLCYLRFDWQRRPAWYAAATAWFIAALLSKSVTASLPAALAVILWWRRGVFGWRRDGAWLVPWLGLSAGMGALTASLERSQIGAQGPDFAMGWLQRCLLAGRVTWFYLGHLLWPGDLIFIYPRWSIDPRQPSQWLGLIAALAILALAFLLRRRARGLLATLLLFGGLLFPALGFINVYPFLFSYVADHFQYLASAAFCASAAIGYGVCCQRGWLGGSRRAAVAIPAAVLVLLFVLTRSEVGAYRDSETLYRTTLARNPQAWLAQLNLGSMLLERGEWDQAKVLLSSAEAAQPDYPYTHFNLGQLHLRQGDMQAAASEFRQSLALRPLDAEACNNLGSALANLGDPAGAETQFATAVRLRPLYPLALCNWAIVLMQQRRFAEARVHLLKALDVQPGYPAAQSLLQQLPPL